MTAIDHTGVTLWRESDDAGGSVYNLLVFTSFAATLWRLLVDSAAEFGAESSSQPFA
ncbi:Sarcosine oxidase, gamma subunit family [compost metagenome]